MPARMRAFLFSERCGGHRAHKRTKTKMRSSEASRESVEFKPPSMRDHVSNPCLSANSTDARAMRAFLFLSGAAPYYEKQKAAKARALTIDYSQLTKSAAMKSIPLRTHALLTIHDRRFTSHYDPLRAIQYLRCFTVTP